ncbi:DUF4202 family protein [Candidatus Uhrbacteria bacterium]|nr:DUF4202 family protein [Candidatus Uhrbacteria bacterium]
MDLYKKTEEFMIDICTKTGKLRDIEHQLNTAGWVKKLKPDADEALLTAAVAHDIERALFGDWKHGSMDSELLTMHQEFSATIVGMFLTKEGASLDFIDRVQHLVHAYEIGGDNDQNVLCDADCLSFFEQKALRQVKNYLKNGRMKEWMKEKLDYMFNTRLKSSEAKRIAKVWYQDAKDELEKM